MSPLFFYLSVNKYLTGNRAYEANYISDMCNLLKYAVKALGVHPTGH
jgi:hypothetical protein